MVVVCFLLFVQFKFYSNQNHTFQVIMVDSPFYKKFFFWNFEHLYENISQI